jgi:cytochrome c peroxidase
MLACSSPTDSGRLLTDIAQPHGFAETAAETAPAGNELTEDRAQLGRRLFHDSVLSRDLTISCATCHQQAARWSAPTASDKRDLVAFLRALTDKNFLNDPRFGR